jgi:hypothetical protein
MINFGQVSFVVEPNDDFTLRFRWVGTDDLRGHGTVLWSCTFHELESERVVQLGYKLVNDQFSAQFSFDAAPKNDDPMQTNYAENARRVGGHQLDVTFPKEALRGLRTPLRKQWSINVNGADIAELTVDQPSA